MPSHQAVMHIPCENPTSSCPVVFPATYPSPRCDCQEDRSTARHCRLCNLPFDIESRFRPDSGLRTFCSCFMGESQVLTVCWMPVFYYLPISGSSGHSGRSSSSRLSTESNHSLPSFTSRPSTGSNHSLPSTIDACLGENVDYSQKHCTEATIGSAKDMNLTNESNHSLPFAVGACLEGNIDSPRKHSALETSDGCLPNDAIVESSVAFDHSLRGSCPADSSTTLDYSSRDIIQDAFVASTSSLLQKDNIVAKDSDLTLLSEEAIQNKDSKSLETEIDCVNYGKGIFPEVKLLQTPTGEATNKNGTLEFTSSHFESNKSRTNESFENLNATEPVSSEGNNLEASPDFSYSACDNLLVQVPMDSGKESTSSANVYGPFISVENGAFSAFEKRNQYSLTRTPMLEETQREIYRPIFLNTNESNLNSAETNTSCLGNRYQMNDYSQPRHQSSAPFYASYPKNSYGNVCNYAESRYPPNPLNVSDPTTNHNIPPQTTPAEPGHEEFTQFAPLNSIEANSMTANVYVSEESRNPPNSHVAQARNPYSNIDMIHHSRSEFQQHAVNVSSGNKSRETFQVSSAQPNRMTTQEHASSDNSSVDPGYNPHGNLASANAASIMSEINFGFEFMGEPDLIQEILNMNLNRNNQLAELIRSMK